jgi:hypothetical protein
MKKWSLEEQMQFLIPFLQNRETVISVVSPPEDDENGEENKDEPLSMADVAKMRLSMDRTTIPSPASSVQSARSTVGGHRKRSRGSSSSTSTANLESALSKFIASRPLPVEPPIVPEKKRKLMNFFEDVAELMMLFSDVDVAEIKNLSTRAGVQPEHSWLCGNAHDVTQWGHKLII